MLRSDLGKIFDLLNPITVKSMGVNINRNTVKNMEIVGLHVLGEKSLSRCRQTTRGQSLKRGKGDPTATVFITFLVFSTYSL